MRFDSTFKTFIKKDLSCQIVPMLLGEPGIGKSSWVEGLAAEQRTRCFTVGVNELADKVDLTGSRLMEYSDPVTGAVSWRQQFFPHATIAEAVDYAQANPREQPILFLDEINRTTPDVTSEALSIPTRRAIGSLPLPPNLRVICAGNDKGNVVALDDASISRFKLYRMEPAVESFRSAVGDLWEGIDRALVDHPGLLVDIPSDEEALELDEGPRMRQICVPRTLHALSRWMSTFDADELRRYIAEPSDVVEGRSVLEEAVVGTIGDCEMVGHVMQAAADAAKRPASQAQAGPVAPDVYEDLLACSTVAELEAAASGLSDNQKSGCLLYALWESADRTALVQTLADGLPGFQQSDLQELFCLQQKGALDQQNLDCLRALDCGAAGQVRTLLGY